MLNLRNVKCFSVVIWTSLLLAGCGGSTGEDGSSTDGGNSVPSGAIANATLNFPRVTFGLESFSAAIQSVYLGPAKFSPDEGADSGLTGKSVWIGIIDDFKTQELAVFRFPSLLRQKTTKADTSGGSSTTNTTTTSTCAIPHEWNVKWTHGELVEQIAGGTLPEQLKPVVLSVPTVSTNAECASKFYGRSPASEAQLKISPIAGVASGASMQRYPVVLGQTADNKLQLFTILGHLIHAIEDVEQRIGVVNLSLGSEISPSENTRQEIIAEALATYPVNAMANTVISVAAGNSGLSCNKENLAGCNLVAVAMAAQDTTKGSTLVVGALTGTGRAQRIATYSNFPGYLKDRFLWASGDSITYPSTGSDWAVGTSFAAPRVAGAAALLRQKYPHLSSVQIADLLLDSANRDMDNDGVPDFEGASFTWGRGKLDLNAALRLAASRHG